MIAALVLASLAGLLALSMPRMLGRARRAARPHPVVPEPAAAPSTPADPGTYPESLTAELDPWDEEYLAFLADMLWPDDEYLDMEHTIDYDGDGETGPGKCH
ncbi:hypothetical protein GCM10010191_30050 [Actinomadura vinacea]|uniref:Uncharacterized protein n=1 Tax=Actinomadura vinacea TaxID=115336 RepID=A0ABP5W1J1_9ACTN